jgi:hypothetical protein
MVKAAPAQSRAPALRARKESGWRVSGILKKTGSTLVGLLLTVLLALPAAAQLKVGETSSNLNGVISAGYTGDYGNQIGSDHSLSFGGTATLTGFYYNPNFLSFTISPFLNQSRDNSAYQSISNASGVNINSSIFGGSHFPGSISYSKAYNSEGNLAIPGVANFTTHGNSDTFGINWAETLPDLPSLSANFQMGSNQYSIYGANANGTTDSRSFGLRSSYLLGGFNLGAYFSDGSSHSEIPQVLEGSTQTETSTSSSHGYGFSVGHQLPMHGGFSSAFNSSYVDSNYLGYSYNGTIDTLTGTASFQPTQKFHYSVSTDYSNNLTGSLYQAITATGGIAVPPAQGQSSHAFDVIGNASYSILPNLQGLATADRRQQFFLGKNYTADSYGGGLTYWHLLFGGSFNSAFTITDNTTSTSSANALGFTGSVNYNKRFTNWAAGGFFSYSQNVETLLITYMSSMYSYGGSIRRNFGQLVWNAGASVSQTGLTTQNGITSKSQSFNSGLTYSKWVSLTASYSKSNGNGIESGAGITVTPTPEPVLGTGGLILFGGSSYGFGLSSNPVRRLTLSASYAKAVTNSSLSGIDSESNTKQINTFFQYQFRKMYLTGGYSNLVQGFNLAGTPRENVSAFFIGVSRWFNFF